MRLISYAVCALLAGCAQSSTIPIAKNAVQITTQAAPVCGATGAQQVALKQGAIETIKRGYTRFTIAGAGYQNNQRTIGYTPVVAQTTHRGTLHGTQLGRTTTASISGTSNTTVTGGQPITIGGHVQKLVVRMYKPGDRGYGRAVDARRTLGKDWKKIVQSGVSMCG